MIGPIRWLEGLAWSVANTVRRLICSRRGHDWERWVRTYRGGDRPYVQLRICARCGETEERPVVSPFDRITVPQAPRHG